MHFKFHWTHTCYSVSTKRTESILSYSEYTHWSSFGRQLHAKCNIFLPAFRFKWISLYTAHMISVKDFLQSNLYFYPSSRKLPATAKIENSVLENSTTKYKVRHVSISLNISTPILKFKRLILTPQTGNVCYVACLNMHSLITAKHKSLL